MEDIIFRPLAVSEYPLLAHFLYEAVFVPPGMQPPERSIVFLPELKMYIENFGQNRGDFAFAAEKRGEIVGIAWCRIMEDFGHYQEGVPSLAISVLKPYRGRGIGSTLLKHLLQVVKGASFQAISLSVQKINPAVSLYKRFGFETVKENADDLIMLCRLNRRV